MLTLHVHATLDPVHSQGTIHDSVEDAKTALLLYRKFQSLQRTGKFTEVMVEAYAALRQQVTDKSGSGGRHSGGRASGGRHSGGRPQQPHRR